jgi:ubiquinone biosynthesis protein
MVHLPTMLRSRFRFAGDFTRAAEVARILVKYGLAASLTEVEWESLHDALKSADGQILAEQPFEVRVRLALTELGTTFIKLGQMLSTRPHLVGTALAAELSKLQESTPPDPADVIRQVVENELGRPIDECFKRFDDEALASASIGQVHRARLKNGRRAIVKVQHPGIEGVIRRDLDILRFLAELAEKNDQLHRYRPAALVREFSRTTLNELDFRREMGNLEIFRRNFAGNDDVKFPKPYPELTTGRVLTMEFLKGSRIASLVHGKKIDIDRQELARRGAEIFVEMIFRDGFYHADPHPGNFLVLPDGTIGLLDAGMVGRIDDSFRRQVEDVLLAAGDRDAERLTEAITRICGTPRDLDRAELSTDLTDFFEQYGAQAIGAFNVSGALTGVMDILHHHHLVLPGRLSMLIKCLVILEGTGRLLSPSFSLVEILRPWRKTILWHRYSPKARVRNLRRLHHEWDLLLESLPKISFSLIDRLEKGNFAVRLEHRHLKSASNRLVVGFFVSALLVASAILIARNVPPLARGVSVFGMVGYMIASLFGFRMLWLNRDKIISRSDDDWD